MAHQHLSQSSITAAAKDKYLAEINGLIKEGAQIQELRGRMATSDQDKSATYAGVEQIALERAGRFESKSRRLLRIFHDELPSRAFQSGEAQLVHMFTDEEAEGERLLDRLWITDVWDSEVGDPIERRCGIDVPALRETMDWLQVLAAKLEASGRKKGAAVPQSLASAKTKDRIRQLRRDGLSFGQICARLDEEAIPTPEGVRKWRGLKWALAYRKHNDTVMPWLSKACKGIKSTA